MEKLTPQQQLTLELLDSCGLGGTPNYKGELALSFCPFHEHNHRSPSLSINIRKSIYRCFACDNRGHVRRILYHFGLDSGDFLNSIYKEGDFENALESILADFEVPDAERNLADIAELESYQYLHPYLLERGFSKDIILRNRIGYDVQKARVTLPIFHKREYHGVIGRTVLAGVEPRYLYPPNLRKGAILYQPKRVEAARNDVEVWCEGSLSALRVVQAGYKAKAILGCYISAIQLSALESSTSTIVLALDADKAGVSGTIDLLERSGRSDITIFNYLPGLGDPGEATTEQIKFGVENALHRLEWMLYNS